jgi:PEP-CTERM motif
MRNLLVSLTLLVTFHLAAVCAWAGLIDVDAYEYKGQVTTVIGHNQFTSHMKVTLPESDWGNLAGTFEKGNREVFVIDEVITTHFWNIYPDVIHVPQPPELQDNITIPFVMGKGSGTGTGFDETISSMPAGASMDSVFMEDRYGNEHEGTFSSFFDIFTDLPLIGPNGEEYTWDLSRIGENQGTWYLSEVTMTLDEFVPEPATLLLLGLGGLMLRKRRV